MIYFWLTELCLQTSPLLFLRPFLPLSKSNLFFFFTKPVLAVNILSQVVQISSKVQQALKAGGDCLHDGSTQSFQLYE